MKIESILKDFKAKQDVILKRLSSYKVLSVDGAKVTIQEVGHKQEGESTSWASCYVMPQPDSFQGEPITKRVLGYRIIINESISLGLWDGNKKYSSWYA